jgi:hypothetical protein
MKMSSPAVVCLIGAVVWFLFAFWLRSFKVREKPPASRAGLSLEERQKKIKIAMWIAFALGWFMLAAGLLLPRIGSSN